MIQNTRLSVHHYWGISHHFTDHYFIKNPPISFLGEHTWICSLRMVFWERMRKFKMIILTININFIKTVAEIYIYTKTKPNSLSLNTWNLKEKRANYTIKWDIMNKSKTHKRKSGLCNLCLEEKLAIYSNAHEQCTEPTTIAAYLQMPAQQKSKENQRFPSQWNNLDF